MRSGTRITASITLLEPIGQGGMGRVWRARHDVLDAVVAVKLLTRSVDELDGAALARFQREARATAKLDSRHVVRVLDAGATADGTPYLVMEHLRGETVAQRVGRTGPLPVAEVACLVDQACKALHAAHRAGILHRDISSGNLFLSADEDGSPWLKVLDFGVAKLANDDTAMTQTGVALGTPRYMSPEQTLGQVVDRRADLWALAAVVYEALTGAPPFAGNTPGAVAVELARGDFVLPSARRDELPRALDAFMTRAFARVIDERFPDAERFAAAFADAVGADVVGASSSVDWRPREAPLAPRLHAVSVGTAEHAGPEPASGGDVARDPSTGGASAGTSSSGAIVTRTPGVREVDRGERSVRGGTGKLVAAATVALGLVAFVARRPSEDPATAPPAVASEPSIDAPPDRAPDLAQPVPDGASSSGSPAAAMEPPDVRRVESRAGAEGSRAKAERKASAKGVDSTGATKVDGAEPRAVASSDAAERGVAHSTTVAERAAGAPPLSSSAPLAAPPPPSKPKRKGSGGVVIDGVTDYGF